MDTLRDITSVRLIYRVVKEVCASLLQSLKALIGNPDLYDQWTEGCGYNFPSLSITPTVGEWREGGSQLLFLQPPHLEGRRTSIKYVSRF